MARIPEPTSTPAGPAYEGRLLDRPTEEVVDQGAELADTAWHMQPEPGQVDQAQPPDSGR